MGRGKTKIMAEAFGIDSAWDNPNTTRRPAYETKDSGERAQFDSGMVRDTEDGKARFDLLLPKDLPYEEQMLTRFADLLARGAEKYTERNWEKANSEDELKRYYSSAFRHFMQWITGETDEDHAAAVFFNIQCAEYVKYKLRNKKADNLLINEAFGKRDSISQNIYGAQ